MRCGFVAYVEGRLHPDGVCWVWVLWVQSKTPDRGSNTDVYRLSVKSSSQPAKVRGRGADSLPCTVALGSSWLSDSS